MTAFVVEFDGRRVFCETMADQWHAATTYAARFPHVSARRATRDDRGKS